MWHIHTILLFSLKEEGNSNTCYNMDKPWKHYAKSSMPAMKGQVMIPVTWNTQKA